MPFKKRFRKRKVKAKKQNVARVVKKEIMKMAENKYHDYSNIVNMTATISINDTTVISQSAGASTDLTRIGDNIQISRLQFRYNIVAASTATSAHTLRVLLIQWLSPTVPVAADILTNTGAGSATVSLYNMDNFRKHGLLKVLYDRTHCISQSSGGPAVAIHQNKWLHRFRHNLNYSTGGTTPNNGCIYLVFVSDTATSTEYPVMEYYQRIQFIDM